MPRQHPHLDSCATLCERKAEDQERFCFPDWTATCLGIGESDTLQNDRIIQHIPGDYQNEVAISKALNSDCKTQSAEITSQKDQDLSGWMGVFVYFQEKAEVILLSPSFIRLGAENLLLSCFDASHIKNKVYLE